MTILATRTRRCRTCAAPVTDRRARWCGSCGALLAAPATDDAAADTVAATPRRWRRGAVAAGAIVVGAALALIVGDDLVDRVVPASSAVQDVAVRTPDQATLADVQRRQPPRPPPLEEPTCVDGPAEACFAWRVEARSSGFDAVLLADEVVVLAETLTGHLAGVDLADGSIRWTVEVPPSNPAGVTVDLTGDLLVHTSGEALVARDVATGTERWSTEELGRVVPYHVATVADGIVVSAGRHGTTRTDGSFEMVAAGLDEDTGEIRWRHGGADVSPLAGGATLLTGFDGAVRVVGPDGSPRWERDGLFDQRTGGGVWGVGHVLNVVGPVGNRLLLASTGEDLGIAGHIIGADDEHTLVEVWTDGDDEVHHSDGRPYVSVAVALIDSGGVVWQAPLDDWDGCVDQLELSTAATVALTTCEGGTIVFDRRDGTLVDHRPAPSPPAPPSSTSGVIPAFGQRAYGPYVLGHAEVGGRQPELVVSDAATGQLVARLPSDTWPAWAPIGAEEGLFGDRFVLQSQRWVTALPVPGDRTSGRVQ